MFGATSASLSTDRPTHRLLDPAQAGGAILDLGVYPVHAVNLFLGEPDGAGRLRQPRGDWCRQPRRRAAAAIPATDERPAATATVICTLETDLPTRLEVFGSYGRIMIDDFFILPTEMLVVPRSSS